METKVKNRAWVKDAAIIFLAILLVLTFFSQTILNRTLTEAATQAVKEGPIVAKVRGKGIVEANGSNNVKAPATMSIAKVMVKTGEKVNTGDVLFVLGPGDSSELEAAKETLIELQTSYDQAYANLPLGGNYVSERNDIEKRRKSLEEAKNNMNEIANALKLNEDSESGQDSGMALSQDEIKYLVDQKNKTIAQVDELRAQRDAIQRQIDAAKNDYDVAARLVEELTALYGQTEDEGERVEIQAKIDAALLEAEAKRTEWESIEQSKAVELGTVIAEVSANEVKLDNLISKLQSLESTSAVGEIGGYTYADYLAAKRSYEDAAADYQAAIANLEYEYAMDSKTQYSSTLSLQAIAGKIERQKEKISKLTGDNEENVITAKTSGTITEINCTSGDTVLKDDILAVIEVPDMGYTLSFSVTNDQARRLKIGDEGTISNFYWGNSITAKLKSIATDKKNPQTQKVLTFELDGDVTAGSELTVSVGQKSANYDLVIPNSSIKNDNNGSFVYVINAKNTPLGNRYIAKRVKVEVLASDDTNSAVNAELASGDFVITTTAAPIKNGDQVRLADNVG